MAGRRRVEAVQISPADVGEARRKRYLSILARDAAGKKVTAVERSFLDDFEHEIAEGSKVKAADAAEEMNGGATIEEDLEEWTLRDGVVRGRARLLSALASAHQVDRKGQEKVLWKIQRVLLARFGFEGTRKSGPLSGNEALALQWVKSIAQLARASQEWELQMEEAERARAGGNGFAMDRFESLVGTLKQLADKRDSLALKVRELSAKERKAGTGRGQKSHNIQIVMRSDGESEEGG